MIGPKSILWTFRQRWTKSTRVCRPSISSQTLESQTLLTFQQGTVRPEISQQQQQQDQTAMAHVVKPTRRLSHDGRPNGWGDTVGIEDVPANLRVVSLLPSATEVIGALGLRDCLVGVTHECDVCPDEAGMRAALAAGVKRVTSSSIDPHVTSQRDIDTAVSEYVAAAAKREVDAARGVTAAASGDDDEMPPLYSVDNDLVAELKPTVILTQSLCKVCAVSEDDVGGAAASCGLHSDAPSTLAEVGASVENIAAACGVPQRGKRARERFEAQLAEVAGAVAGARSSGKCSPRPSVLLLEWLDPVFDGGHWVPGMMRVAGCEPGLNSLEGSRSSRREWDDVVAADPDVVLVACCGFDLRRNAADAAAALAANNGDNPFAKLRAVRMGRCFVLDGNKYFARPAPALAVGAALVARCAHDGDENVVAALERLLFYPDCAKLDDDRNLAWARVEGAGAQATELNHLLRQMPEAGFEEPDVPDIEDFDGLHEEACARGDNFYIDPKSGYMVMTRVKHEARGRCCGSGCRHCPFAHVNVRDKARCIQVPAMLNTPAEGLASEVIVLMWSGGKDSFLALRAMLKPGGALHKVGTSGVVLLTTFDATSRIVAHQEVGAKDVEKQAQHLNVGLVGVPLHRHAGTGYVSRLEAAISVVKSLGCKVKALACGDLHLEHIRSWREEAVGRGLGMKILYPVWSDVAGENYAALTEDLIASGVPCTVTAVTDDVAAAAGATVGAEFTPELTSKLQASGKDAFGEKGEFHTLARVWKAPRQLALGI